VARVVHSAPHPTEAGMNVTTTMACSTMACSCNATIQMRRLARERDALATRVRILEGALNGIQRETELALNEPALAFLVTRRVASITRQAR
jgi:hypothetical protein